jgi:transcriptional regulator with XRE-family HTH domain
MQVTVHKQFSENLRALCLKRGTIAEVCRDIEINRQQFNKYLSGASLPNPATMAKLAKYFAVDQIEFFQSPGALRGTVHDDSHVGLHKLLLSIPGVLTHLDRAASQSLNVPVQEGCYHIHYPWLFDPALLVRSVVVIFSSNGFTFFRRYTRLQTGTSEKLRHYPRGWHEGMVFRHEGNVCFLGRNAVGFGEVSLQTFAFENFLTEDAITGLSLVVTPWGEYCSLRATLSYFGPIASFRKALRLAKIGPIAKSSVPPFVRHSVTSPLTSSIPQLRPFSHDEWLRIMGFAQESFEAAESTQNQ